VHRASTNRGTASYPAKPHRARRAEQPPGSDGRACDRSAARAGECGAAGHRRVRHQHRPREDRAVQCRAAGNARINGLFYDPVWAPTARIRLSTAIRVGLSAQGFPFPAPAGVVDYAASIRVDQGSEFISRDLDLWTYTRGVVLDFSRPGKPTDNAFIESFNGKFRAECLNQHWFMSLDDAVQKCEAWRRDYNEVRPHSAIGNRPPISLLNRSAAHGLPLPVGAG